MASSGNFSTTNQYIKYKIIVTETSTSDENNTSTINIKVKAWRTNPEYTGSTNYAGSCSVKVDGTSLANSTWNYDDKPIKYHSSGDDGTVLYDKNTTVPHNSDGSKTVKVEAKFELHYTNGGIKWNSNFQGFNVTLSKLQGECQISIDPLTVGINSIIFTATATEVCTNWLYSLDAGKTFTPFSTSIGTTVNKTITGLTPNTMYRVMVAATKNGTTKVFKSYVHRAKTSTDLVHRAVDNNITLFERNATSFATNGLGSLPNAVECVVTEERNGIYELSMRYPISGLHYDDIAYGRIICAKPNQYDDPQPFRIYAISKPHSGIVTINAEHISYDLTGYTLPPFKIGSITQAFALLNNNSKLDVPCPFTFLTDKSNTGTIESKVPTTIRTLLGGGDNSILEVFGGEFEFDGYQVNLWTKRGSDRGITIRYGKNLTSLKQDENCNNMYTAIRPFWYKEVKEDTSSTKTKKKKKNEGGLVVLDEKVVTVISGANYTRILPLDLTSEFDKKPTQAQLRAKTQQYIAKNNLDTPEISLDVSFVQLSDSLEYHDIAMLERVQLCDEVSVEFPELGVSAKSQVVKTEYNVLSQRYNSIELGTIKANLSTTLADNSVAIKEKVTRTELDYTSNDIAEDYEEAINNANNMISGYNGGSIVLDPPDNPSRLLLMDTDEMSTATKVWQWNINGLGFSDDGINGDYGDDVAITNDGHINANFITVGYLDGNIIEAGSIQADAISQEYTDSIQDSIDGSANAVRQEFCTANAELSSRIEQTRTELDGDMSVVNASISEIRQNVDSINFAFTNQVIGGVNLIQNSAGLNGVDINWTASGVSGGVYADHGSEAQSNTVSGSMFVLSSPNDVEFAKIEQEINVIPGREYVFSLISKQTTNYVCIVSIDNGGSSILVYEGAESGNWTESEIHFVASGDTITISVLSHGTSLYVSDLMLTEGNLQGTWTPAANEIYTENVKIDKQGINISNSESLTHTQIDHEMFAIWHQDEKVLQVNKDLTTLARTDVVGKLTVGKGQFVPHFDSNGNSDGMDFVLLD